MVIDENEAELEPCGCRMALTDMHKVMLENKNVLVNLQHRWL